MINKNETVAKVELKKIFGDVLIQNFAGMRFILNFCSMSTKPEGELIERLDKRWPRIKKDIRSWYVRGDGSFKLGNLETSVVQSDVWVVHLLCEDEKGKVVKTELENCLKKVADFAEYERATVHVSDLLVSKFPKLTKLLEKSLVDKGVHTTVYYKVEAEK